MPGRSRLTARVALSCGLLWLAPGPPLGGLQHPPCPSVKEQLTLPVPALGCTAPPSAPALGRHRAPVAGPPLQRDEEPLAPARAFLYSAVLPGAAQQKLGQRRWIAYLILEGASWVAFGRARTSAFDSRDRYQTLSWDAARTPFSGSRSDGDFAYYEAMERFERSGAYDVDPSMPGVQPQTDLSTFNGATWALAMQIFLAPGTHPAPGDPAYDDALAFYRAEAYDERFEWTWEGRAPEWAEYRGLIESSDNDFRRASQFLGVVIANHLLSAVDGFITARTRWLAGPGSVARLRWARDRYRGGMALVLQVRR